MEDRRQSITPESPEQQSPAPQQAEVATPFSGGGSKKKRLVLAVIALVILLAGGGVAAYLITRSTEEKPSVNESSQGASEDQNEISNFEPKLVLVQDRKVSYLGSDNKVKTLTTLSAEDEIRQVAVVDGKASVIYTRRSQDYGLASLRLINSSGSQKIADFPANTGPYSGAKLSPNRTRVILEKAKDLVIMEELFTFDIKTAGTKSFYTPANTSDGLLQFELWVNDESALFATQTCRECDGPIQPKLTLINTTSGDKRVVFNSGSEEFGSASYYTYPGSDSVIISLVNPSTYFDEALPGDDPYPLKITRLKKTDWTQNELEVYRSHYSSLVGVGKENVYITTRNLVETSEDNPNYATSDENGVYAYDTAVLYRLNVATGQNEQFKLGAALNERMSVRQVIETAEGVYLLVEESNNKNNGQRVDVSSSFKLFLLASGSSEMILLHESPSSLQLYSIEQ